MFSLPSVRHYIQILSAGVFRILHNDHCDAWNSVKYMYIVVLTYIQLMTPR